MKTHTNQAGLTGYRVFEIAKSAGVTSREFVEFLQARGHFVRSASSLIEPPIYAETLLVAFRGEYDEDAS